MDFSPLTRFLDSLPAYGIPGCDCMIMQHREPIYRHQTGYADLKSRLPISSDTLYYLYSATKVVTCAAMLQLYERGAFLMTDPLSDYLPEFSHMMVRKVNENGTTVLAPARKKITIRDLFTMSAGLSYDMHTPPIDKVLRETNGNCTTRQIVSAIAESPLLFEPGEHWLYSLAHDVLGALIEVLSGKSFGQYLKENIFDPLGMKDTGFTITEEQRGRLATQYRFNETTRAPEKTDMSNRHMLGQSYQSGGAGLVSSVEDCIAFGDALCGAKLLSRRTVDLMRTNHLDQQRMRDFDWIQMVGYGYGLGVRTMVDRARSGSAGPNGEFGWGGAAGAYLLIDPENDLTLFYAEHMLNSQEPYIHPRIRNIMYSCLE